MAKSHLHTSISEDSLDRVEDEDFVAPPADVLAKKVLGLRPASKPVFVLTVGADHYDYSGLEHSSLLFSALQQRGRLVQPGVKRITFNGYEGTFDKYKMDVLAPTGTEEVDFLVYYLANRQPMVFYKGYGHHVRSMVSSLGHRLRSAL